MWSCRRLPSDFWVSFPPWLRRMRRRSRRTSRRSAPPRAPELSYSHSDGRVEDKATFIANATSGKSKFLSLAYQDPKIRVVGPAAIVRFHWVAESEAVADGKKSSTNLHILMNWQKQGADWKLLSRAATKL